jgi:hypothetical protein
MEAILSSETSVLTKAKLRNIPENGITHIDHRGNLNPYISCTISLWSPGLTPFFQKLFTRGLCADVQHITNTQHEEWCNGDLVVT